MKTSNNEHLDNLRHSCAHLLAAAVLKLWPNTKQTIGPAIENGFYYDFDLSTGSRQAIKISESDLSIIEREMRSIVKDWKSFRCIEVDKNKATKQFSNNEYKQELIKQFCDEEQRLTLYKSGNYIDLCRGGHVNNPNKELKHFKLLSIAGAYWRGDEKNKMLTRIYGTIFETKEELDKYLWQQEEAKKRDHRKIGKQQQLFLISQDVGSGLPIFTPKGFILRNQIENYIISEKKKRGYEFVWTPHIAKSDLYRKSGHWQKYDAMFSPMKIEMDEYVAKPMNCPHHFQIYLNKPRSYRDLPMRIAENGTCYRYEKSGELNGLLRVRSLTVDDTHTFVRQNQISSEIDSVLSLIESVFARFGFPKYKAWVSIREPGNMKKYLGNNDIWKKAEKALIDAVKSRKMDYVVKTGEAAFYGPKIDVMVEDSLARQWQLSTCQLDFNQPENFSMSYINEKGKEEKPAVLHIAILGSIERFMGILIEHYAGAFPLWLAPIQVVLIPIADRHLKQASNVKKQLEKESIRVEIDKRSETMQAKIRDATLQKVPFMGIIGDRETKDNTISARNREGKNLKAISTVQFINQLKKSIEKKTS